MDETPSPLPPPRKFFLFQSFVDLKGRRSLQCSRFGLPCTEINFMSSSEIEMIWFLSDTLCPSYISCHQHKYTLLRTSLKKPQSCPFLHFGGSPSLPACTPSTLSPIHQYQNIAKFNFLVNYQHRVGIRVKFNQKCHSGFYT